MRILLLVIDGEEDIPLVADLTSNAKHFTANNLMIKLIFEVVYNLLTFHRKIKRTCKLRS